MLDKTGCIEPWGWCSYILNFGLIELLTVYVLKINMKGSHSGLQLAVQYLNFLWFLPWDSIHPTPTILVIPNPSLSLTILAELNVAIWTILNSFYCGQSLDLQTPRVFAHLKVIRWKIDQSVGEWSAGRYDRSVTEKNCIYAVRVRASQ